MTTRLRLLLPIAAFIFPALGHCAEDGEACVRGEPAPVFPAAQAGITSHSFNAVSSHEARERVELASGVSVAIHHQGCEYFVTTFRFEGAGILKGGASSKASYQAAAELLRQLGRMKADPGFDLALAAATLEQASRGAPLEFEQELPVAGDGTDFLQSQVKVDNAGRKSKVGFVQVTLFKGPL
jgi:hypothetical protein